MLFIQYKHLVNNNFNIQAEYVWSNIEETSVEFRENYIILKTIS